MARLSFRSILLFWSIALIDLIALTYALSHHYHLDAGLQSLFYTIEGVMLAALFLMKIPSTEKPWVDITMHEDRQDLGFMLIARKKGLHHPRATLDNKEQELFKMGATLSTPIEFMYVDVPYVFYPFRISRSSGKAEGWVRIEVTDAKTGNNVYTGDIHSTNGKVDRIASIGWVMEFSFNSEEAEEQKRFMGGLLPRIEGDPLKAPLGFLEDRVTLRQRLFGRKIRAQDIPDSLRN